MKASQLSIFRCRALLVTLSALVVLHSFRRIHRMMLDDDRLRHDQHDFYKDFIWSQRLANDRNRHNKTPSDTTSRMDFTKLLNEKNSPPWALFYNVYVPDSAGPGGINAQTAALQLIEEQLGQIGRSYAATRYLSQKKRLHVFYNSIGTPINSTLMQRICRDTHDLVCHNLQHYVSAFEEVTLQRVYEYCQDFPHHKIIYLHSKGSYNSRGGRNQYWRRHMTHAVTHQLCLEPPQSMTCNMCGLVFNPLPWIHYSGNFFTANCDYIQKLLPIAEYAKKMDELAVLTRQHKNESRILFQLFPDKDAYLGLERYASENWLGSHPDVVACDLSPEEINAWKNPRGGDVATFSEAKNGIITSLDQNKSLVLSPVGEIESLLHLDYSPRSAATHGKDLLFRSIRYIPGKRLREYYFLAGHVLKWQYLYNHIPRNDSWVWTFFPDGDIWKSAYYNELQLQSQSRSDLLGDAVLYSLLEPFAAEDRKAALKEVASDSLRQQQQDYQRSQIQLRQQRRRKSQKNNF